MTLWDRMGRPIVQLYLGFVGPFVVWALLDATLLA